MGESSIICKVLTKKMGVQNFIVKGVRSNKSKKKLNFFEPLKLINIEAHYNNKKPLQYLTDVNNNVYLNNTKNKHYKYFVSFFIAETISKVLQENEHNDAIFNFVWETTTNLYNSDKKDPNFILKYLLNLSKLLGFYPSTREIKYPFFNLESGSFSNNKGNLSLMFNKTTSNCLKKLLTNKEVFINREERTEMIKGLMLYYKTHHYNLDNIKSHLIIEALRV